MSGYGLASSSAAPYAGPSALNGDMDHGDTLPVVEVPLGPTNQPRMLVRSLNRDEAVFHLSGVEGGLANALRRVVMADVPTVGE
jgi:DNA-directed RNA polymerase II subunit RPB3